MPPKKRTALEALDANGGDLYAEYVEALEGAPIDMNADQVRRRIRTFLDSGAMTTGEFQDAIGVNSKGYNMFMTQTGRDKGTGSNTFQNAWVYFKAREMKGLAMPKKPRVAAPKAVKGKATDGGAEASAGKGTANGEATTAAAAAATATASTSVNATKAKGTKASATDEAGPPDVSDMTLPREETDDVLIYDSCDEIRRKINAHLKLPGVTQASFLRTLAAQYHTREVKIQGKQLSDFRSRKGATAGNTSVVYRGVYTYFEKLRLKADKPKTKHRLEVEKTWRNGFDTDKMPPRYFHGRPGDYVTEDAMGRMTVHRG